MSSCGLGVSNEYTLQGEPIYSAVNPGVKLQGLSLLNGSMLLYIDSFRNWLGQGVVTLIFIIICCCCRWADKLTGKVLPTDTPHHAYTLIEPLGVVAAITPWNFPLMGENLSVKYFVHVNAAAASHL